MRSAAPIPSVEITVDGARCPPRPIASLASVRVARRLSLPAQCEVASRCARARRRRPCRSRLPIGRVVGRHRGRRSRPRCSTVRSPPTSGCTRPTARPSCASAPTTRCTGCASANRSSAAPTSPWRSSPTSSPASSGSASADEVDGPAGRCSSSTGSPTSSCCRRWPSVPGCGSRSSTARSRCSRWTASATPIDLTLHDDLLAARFDATADPACTSVTGDRVGSRGAPSRSTGEAGSPRVRPRCRRRRRAGCRRRRRGALPRRRPRTRPRTTSTPLAQAELDRRVAREVTLAGTRRGRRPAAARPPRPRRRRPPRRVRRVRPHRDRRTRSTPSATWSSSRPRPRPSSSATQARRRRSASSPTADDPDGLGRVTVELPGYGDVETDWREVLVPGAGAGKGIVAIPDERRPGAGAAAARRPGGRASCSVACTATSQPVRPRHRRRGGPPLVAADRRRPARRPRRRARPRSSWPTATAARSCWHPTSVTVHAKADLVIECPGKTMTLRANRIELEQADVTVRRPVATETADARSCSSSRPTVSCDHDGTVSNNASQELGADRRGIRCSATTTPRAATSAGARTAAPNQAVRQDAQGRRRLLRRSSTSAVKPVVLATLEGKTDGTPPGVVHYRVRDPGQRFVMVSV